MKKTILTFFWILIWWALYGQSPHPKLQGLDEEIEFLLNQYEAVGLSVAVVKEDSLIYSKGFGLRDREKNLPMNENTSIPIGSTTKTFTSALFGILYADGKISFQEKPSKYIPQLEFYNDKMDNIITVGDLLSHKSGIGSVDASHVFFPPLNGNDFIARFKHLKPNGEISNSFQYSNAGYALLGQILENITRTQYEKYIRQNLFEPLGLTGTYVSIDQMINTNNFAKPYGKLGTNQEHIPFHYFGISKPDGAVISSANDMGKWMITWLNNGRYKSKQIIPESYINIATTLKNILPQNNANHEDFLFGYGYGWFVQASKGEYLIQHGGNTAGFSCQLALYPHKKIGIIAMTNQHNSALPYFVEDIISNRLLDYERKAVSEYPTFVTDIYPIPESLNSFNIETKITHQLNDYCGKYENKGHGIVSVIEENGHLFIIYPEYKFRLEHEKYNTFRMQPITEVTQYAVPDFQLNFNINEQGEIDLFDINFQPEHVIFHKIDN